MAEVNEYSLMRAKRAFLRMRSRNSRVCGEEVARLIREDPELLLAVLNAQRKVRLLEREEQKEEQEQIKKESS